MSNRYRLATLLLCWIAGFPLSAGAMPYDLDISGPGNATQGDLVTFDYGISDGNSLVTLDLELTYDPLVFTLLSLASTTFGTDPACGIPDDCVTWFDTGSQVNVGATSFFGLPVGALPLVSLNFRVLPGAVVGPTSLVYGSVVLSTDPFFGGGPVDPADISTTGAVLTVAAAPSGVPVAPSWVLLLSGLGILSAPAWRRAAGLNQISEPAPAGSLL